MCNYFTPKIFSFIFIFYSTFTYSCDQDSSYIDPPKGAITVGATDLMFSFCPSLNDLNFEGSGRLSKLYNGIYFTGPRDKNLYEMVNGNLVLNLQGIVSTIPVIAVPGELPLLKGSSSFYIEVTASISENDPDHWPAIWLMPIEHNQRLEDVYDSSQPGYEQWLEIDIDEGGFGPGTHNTAISWHGKWPKYEKIQNPHTSSSEPLDRTKPHTYGLSYDPTSLTVFWWLDGKLINQSGKPFVPDVVLKQNFYLIISAQSHKLKKPYKFNVYNIKAYQGR